jgi:site-specific recombinase XerD
MFISKATGKSRHTIEWYTFLLRDFAEWLENVSGKPFEILSEYDIIRYLGYLEQKGFRKASIASYWSGLRAFLKFCYKEEIFSEDITHHVPTPKRPKVFPYVLNEEQVRKLLKATNRGRFKVRNKTIILTFLDTGIRLSELTKLNLQDVDLKSGTIHVEGKGEKSRVICFGRRLQSQLARYLESRGFIAYEDAFFVANKVRIKNLNVQLILRRIAARAGLESSRVSPHTLRRTCATHMLQQGADIRYIQKQLGHARLETTQRAALSVSV